MENPLGRDPFTGGQHADKSTLLNIPIPRGFQSYPSHGYSILGMDGQKEGLEIYRGAESIHSASLAMFNTLKAAGWQLRLSLRKSDRAVSLYQKGNRYALLAFHMQGMLTIMEIWTGASLPDGAALAGEAPAVSEDAIAGEEYGPIEESAPLPGAVEQFGSNLEEKEL